MSSHELTLKSPIYEDETIAISSEWTVAEFKSHLAHTYTPRPKVEHQRLIYCGRLLKDEHLLKDILKKEEKTYIHIICTSSLTEVNQSKFLPKETVGKIQAERHTSQAPSTLPNINYGSDLYNVTYNNSSLPMYSNEYMQIYHQSLMDSWNLYYYNINQYYQSVYNPNFSNFSPMAMNIPPISNLPYLNNTPVVENENNQNNLINDPNVANNAGANNMMAAPGGIGLGAAEEPNGNERVDFVDWIYVLFRVGILFSILYFYSSIHRFMVVLLFSTLIFLYQAGFLVYPLRRNNPPVTPEQAPTPPNENGSNNPDQTLDEPTFPRVEAENEVQPDLSSRVKEKMLVVWNGTRAVLIVFATFFTSLIPDRPPPVNLN